MPPQENGATLRLALTCVVAVCLTWLLHEGGHWAMGRFLGYPMAMTLNTAFPLANEVRFEDSMWISAAGPIVTLIQAVVACVLIVIWTTLRRDWALHALPFLLVCCYMRLLASVVGIFLKPNDETRISLDLGWSKSTLPLLVVGFLAILLGIAWQKLRPRFYFVSNCLLWIMVTSSLIIILDNLFKPRIF